MKTLFITTLWILSFNVAQAKNFETVIKCVTAQDSTVEIRINEFRAQDEIQHFHDGSIIIEGKAKKVYISGNSIGNILALTTDGRAEFSLDETISSEDEAGESLDGGGVMAYNAMNSREDYKVLSKDQKKNEKIVMSRTKNRGEGIYQLPHLLKCSQE